MATFVTFSWGEMMFKADIDKVKELHETYQFEGPLLDAGGLSDPTIADYSISAAKALNVTVEEGRVIKVPHPNQSDRYLKIHRPWSFIDENYTIENPEEGSGLYIEDLPEQYKDIFNTVIMVSVFEHVKDPFEISKSICRIMKPEGYFFNSTPFIFPYHPSPEDNYRFSPNALKYIHNKTGFEVIESGFHLQINTGDGVGDTNPERYGQPQAIWASYALCRKKKPNPESLESILDSI